MQQPVRTLAHWTKCRAKVCVYVSVFAVLGLEVFFALQLFVLSYAVCTLLFLTFEHTFVCVVCFNTGYICVAIGYANKMFKSTPSSEFQLQKPSRFSTLK